MKVSYQPLIPLVLAVLLVSGCSDDSDQEALKLYNEASQVMDAAQAEQSPISCALLVAKTSGYYSCDKAIEPILTALLYAPNRTGFGRQKFDGAWRLKTAATFTPPPVLTTAAGSSLRSLG